MAIHVNTYGPMQLDLLTMKIILVIIVHVLLSQEEILLLLLAITTTVNLELEAVVILTHITYPTHCGMVQVVLLTTHVVLTLINHQLSEMTQDDIEVRICRNVGFSDEATLVDNLEFYIQ